MRRLLGLWIATSASLALAQEVTVDEIIRQVVARNDSQNTRCSSYTCQAVTQSIKFDKKMRPDEITTMRKQIYHNGKRVTEVISSIDKDGRLLSPEETAKKIREQNEDWEKKQRDPERAKKGSRENYVDPLGATAVSEYSYFLIAKHDSTIAIDTSGVAGAKANFDNSVARLRTIYVVQARPKQPSEKHLNATYLIDGLTFGVLRLEFAPSKMPSFVDTLHFRFDYAEWPRDDGTVNYFPQRFAMTGRAGFLFFKGRFGAVEEMTDYQCHAIVDSARFEQRYWYEAKEQTP